jgi:hypothetical protein
MDQGVADKMPDRLMGYFAKANQNPSQVFKILCRGTLVEYGK